MRNGQLPPEPAPADAPAEVVERPGCVTVHAAAAAAGAGLAALFVLSRLLGGALSLFAGRALPISLFGEAPTGALMAVALALQAVGLWRMSLLGWGVTMVVHGLSGALSLWAALLLLIIPPDNWSRAIDTLVVLALSALMVGWYYPRRRLFDSDSRGRTAWLTGRPAPQVVGKLGRLTIAGLAAVALATLLGLVYLLTAT
jgi:hypothetical protein